MRAGSDLMAAEGEGVEPALAPRAGLRLDHIWRVCSNVQAQDKSHRRGFHALARTPRGVVLVVQSEERDYDRLR